MEIKNLVLLMLIPIMLIGLVVYTDENPTITGAQTAQIQQKVQDNILGTYSIMPSFRAKVDYNLQDEYKAIKEKFNGIIDDCKNAQDIGQCFKDYADKFGWNCVELRDESVDILYDFADKFNECINLEENGVVCKFSLDERSILNLPNTFDIILQRENQRIKVVVKRGANVFYDYINMENLVYTDYDNRDTLSENLNPVKLIIDYSNKKPVVADAYGIDASSNRIPLSKTILLYKKDNFVKFVEAPGSSFEAPVPANKVIDLPRTKGYKFCAKSTSNRQFYAYDKSDNSVKLRDVIYKFSITYPK